MSLRPSPLVIGHRGASGYRPEHTRSAYELAIALGADALEPDIVATRDGVLVLRHENEISGTTDVATHPEFADRRTTKRIDGVDLTGWFTEDFTWAELSTLRARERIGAIRRSSASYDDRYPILRLAELFEILDRAREDGPDAPGDAGANAGSSIGAVGLVAEIKHANYFEGIGLPLDELFTAELAAAGWEPRDERLTIEAFEKTVLDRFSERGVGAKRVYLVEGGGAPADLVARDGSRATPYSEVVTPAGLARLARGIDGPGTGGPAVDGVSVDKNTLFVTDARGHATRATSLIDDAHAAGLEIYCWTLRPENRFLNRAHRLGKDPAAFGDWRREFELILRAGIDGVFADHPDLAIEAREGCVHLAD